MALAYGGRCVVLAITFKMAVDGYSGMGRKLTFGMIHGAWNIPIAASFLHHQFLEDQRLSSLFHNGTWHIPNSLHIDVQNMLSQATSSLIPDPSCRDTLSWITSIDGSLSLKSAWHAIRSIAIKLIMPNLI